MNPGNGQGTLAEELGNRSPWAGESLWRIKGAMEPLIIPKNYTICTGTFMEYYW